MAAILCRPQCVDLADTYQNRTVIDGALYAVFYSKLGSPGLLHTITLHNEALDDIHPQQIYFQPVGAGALTPARR